MPEPPSPPLEQYRSRRSACTSKKDLETTEELRTIYNCAQALRNCILCLKTDMPFPPDASDLSEEIAIPTILHNFLWWLLCGPKCTDVPSLEEQIKLRDVPAQRRVLSIAQDIIFLLCYKS